MTDDYAYSDANLAAHDEAIRRAAVVGDPAVITLSDSRAHVLAGRALLGDMSNFEPRGILNTPGMNTRPELHPGA